MPAPDATSYAMSPCSTNCTAPNPRKIMVKTMPRENQEVLHALLKGGNALQKRQGLPR